MKVENFDELFNFISSSKTEDIINEVEKNYNYEVAYQNYKKFRIQDLINNKKYIPLIWHKYLTKYKIIGKILEKNFFIKFPNEYFGGRPFECVFKNLTPAPYGENSPIPPTFNDATKEIKEHILEYKTIFENLSDEFSKKTLFTTLLARIFRDPSLFTKNNVRISKYEPCFDKSLLNFNSNDTVFVDCGGYIGDTVKKFIKIFHKYKRIYVYEPKKSIFKKLETNLKKYNNIVINNSGVSDKNGKVMFSPDGGMGGGIFNNNSNQGQYYITTVTIDDDIREHISFIKMDIEGEELNALMGAKMHIVNESPVLAINVYHKLSDIRKCFNYINQTNPNYKLYLRQYGHSYIKNVLYAKI